MVFLFWISTILIFYAYVGYPLTLWLMIRFRKTAPSVLTDLTDLPKVSVVISARNEESIIEARLHNILQQTYPGEKIELVVVSDGSTDDTALILKKLGPELESAGLGRVHIIELSVNGGKPNALNLAIKDCRNEIIIMADARQSFEPDTITALVVSLQDPDVGCVSGELLLTDSDDERASGVEMGLYWRYERFIRGAESKVSSVIGMTGAIYAIRKSLYLEIPPDTLIDDVLIPMNVIHQGYKARFTSQAMAFDKVSSNPKQEWHRKTRTMAGNWQLLFRYPWLLSPQHNPVFVYFFSHKVMRLLVPFLIVTTLSSGYLLMTPFYIAASTALMAVLLLGIIGLLFPYSRNARIVSLAFFFLVLNTAVVVGLYRYLHPARNSLWTDAHKETV